MTQFMDAAVVSCPCNEDDIPLQTFPGAPGIVASASTHPKHEGVHFFLDVPVAHPVSVLVLGLQQHVQERLSLPPAVVGVAVRLQVGDVFRPFGDHLSGGASGGLVWTFCL